MKANRQNTYNMPKHHITKQSIDRNSRQIKFSVSKGLKPQQQTLASLFEFHSQNQIIIRCCQNIEIIVDKKSGYLYDSTNIGQRSQVCLNVGSGIAYMLKQCFEVYQTDTQRQYIFSAIQPNICLQTETHRNQKAKLHFSKDQSETYKPSTYKQKPQNITILNISLDQDLPKQQNSGSLKFSTQKDNHKQSFDKAGRDYNKQNQKTNKIEKYTIIQTDNSKTVNEVQIIDCVDDPKFSFATGKRKSLIAQQAPRKQKLMNVKGSYHQQAEQSKNKPKQTIQPPLNEISAPSQISTNVSGIKQQQDYKVIEFIKPQLKDTNDNTKKVRGEQFNPIVQKIELSHLTAEHDKRMNNCVSITETKNEQSNESQFTVRYNFKLTDKKNRTEVLRISPLRFRTPLKTNTAPLQMIAKHRQ